MNHAEYTSELVKRVTAAAVKAISGDREINVNFTHGGSYASEDSVQLPSPTQQVNAEAFTKLRGVSDSLALKLLYHDDDLHHKHMPAGANARAVFEAIEQVRCEALGANRLSGVADNLNALLDERCRAKGYTNVTERNEATLPDVIGILVRERLTGQPAPKVASRLLELWRPELNERIGRQLRRANSCANDQEAFADLVMEMIAALDLIDKDDDTRDPDEDQDNNAEDAIADSEDTVNAEIADDGGMTSQRGEAELSKGDDFCDGGDDQCMTGDGEEDPAGPSQLDNQWPRNDGEGAAHYRTYTTQFDEVIEADEMCDPDELNRLRHQLDQQLSHLQGVVSRLANRLQRQLMAKQTRSWEFDLEEGMLDAGRLSRVVVDPVHPLSFKREYDTEFRDTVVTLLIDNSGSMRGRPITVAAMSADILARTLERCGVKVEILGFTTRSWKGGSARERWVNHGKPNNPGRLNDLRHIVYKAADSPWRRSRRNLGLMLREGLLKENIDGEALIWAHQRLLARPEQRRILMVISDGAPVDDATLSANPGNYLERHLRDVIDWIENCSEVEITAIGIGHDVTRYYSRAVTLIDAEELGGTMMNSLAQLFDEDCLGLHLRRSA
ncbi:MAG: cobaltochelatase subunit CobT [Rhodospirillales bacterium]